MTTTQDITTGNALANFLGAVRSLIQDSEKFAAGAIASVPFSRLREEHLATALRELATLHGTALQLPLQINSNGEFSVVALQEGQTSARMGSGAYGSFAEVLNPHRPRCGVFGSPPAQLEERSGWCYLNHFDAERLVMEQYAKLSANSGTASGQIH